jgi:hypothetical protein
LYLGEKMAKTKKEAGRKARSRPDRGRTSRVSPRQVKRTKMTKPKHAPLESQRSFEKHQTASYSRPASAMRSVRVHLEESPPPNKDQIEPIIVDLFLSPDQRQHCKWFVLG